MATGLDSAMISSLAEAGYGDGTEARHEALFSLLVDVAETYVAELMDPRSGPAAAGRAEAVMVTVAGLRENLEDVPPSAAPADGFRPYREYAKGKGNDT